MLEVTKYTNGCGYIYLISNILMLYQICDITIYVNSYASNTQRIVHKNDLYSLPLWIDELNENLKKVHLKDYELLPVFTLTNHSQGDELDWHFDKKHSLNEKLKMVMYLTESSGTEFKMNNGVLKLKPHKGDIVLFDLCYEHRGSPLGEHSGAKLLFGMRIGYVD